MAGDETPLHLGVGAGAPCVDAAGPAPALQERHECWAVIEKGPKHFGQICSPRPQCAPGAAPFEQPFAKLKFQQICSPFGSDMV